MNIEFTETFEKKTAQLIKKNQQLRIVFKKQFNLFAINPFYPSLRLHKLQGKRSEQYALWITGDLSALGVKSKSKENTYVFFDIVTHDEY